MEKVTTRTRTLCVALLIFAGTEAAWLGLSGCQQQPGGAATQPSLATLTTQADAAMDAAVNSITLGRQLGVIDDATFKIFVVPSVMAARDATRQMEAAAQKGDQNGWQTAQDAATAALSRLRPIIDRANQAQVKGAK